MKEYTVCEVEKSDWDSLEAMSIEEAKEVLDESLAGYLGGYERGSTDTYHYYKARIYTAVRKIVDELNLKMQEERNNRQ